MISGDGLENIYQAIVVLDGLTLAPRSAADITKCALSGDCQIAREALAKFCAFLGSFAGNVALTFGARGGVYIAGGISPRIVDFMARSEFRNRFEAKGRLRPYLKTIPSYVIVHPAAAFLGLKSLSLSSLPRWKGLDRGHAILDCSNKPAGVGLANLLDPPSRSAPR
jgi:glucokinase